MKLRKNEEIEEIKHSHERYCALYYVKNLKNFLSYFQKNLKLIGYKEIFGAKKLILHEVSTTTLQLS